MTCVMYYYIANQGNYVGSSLAVFYGKAIANDVLKLSKVESFIIEHVFIIKTLSNIFLISS
jgi:hypothetical protein